MIMIMITKLNLMKRQKTYIKVITYFGSSYN